VDGFQVTRPIVGKAGAAARPRADLTTAGPTFKLFAGRASTASGARPALRATRPLLGRSQASTGARAALVTVLPPGTFAKFRILVAGVLSNAQAPVSSVFAMLRSTVAGALALDDDWEVHPLPVDSLTPPAFMLEWGDPWSEQSSHCFESASLDVVCVAGRIEPDPGIETLELMVEAALVAFAHAGIPHGPVTPPRPFEIAGLTYLAARIPIHSNVNVGV
jgi:hypothetical protein